MSNINPANPKEVILAILNQTNNTNVLETDVEFGVPQRATGANPIRNTILKISPKADSGYYGDKVIWYNRIHIDDLGIITVNKGTDTLYSQLIPKINQKYGIYLSINDINDGPLPVNQTGDIVVNLSIKSSSLMFYSGARIITPGFNPGAYTNILTPAVWDSLIKSSLITITPNDFEITSNPGISMIRTTSSFSTGKRYFEITNSSPNGLIGFGTADAQTDVLLGSDSNSWALDTFTGLFTHNSNTVLDLSSEVSRMGNLAVGFMLDLDNKTLTLVLNTNFQVPVTGLVIPNEAIFVMAGNKSTTANVTNIRANFGNESFLYTTPFNYYPGFGSGGTPVYPAAGTLLFDSCNGFDLVGTYANGSGGTYTAVITANSVTCGYQSNTTPSPVTTLPPSTQPGTYTTITVDSTSQIIDEADLAIATFTLNPVINQNVLLNISLVENTTDTLDYSNLEYRIGNNAWQVVPSNSSVIIPSNTQTFEVRIQLNEDQETEGLEIFDIVVSKQQGSTNVSNNVEIIKTFNINDSSASAFTAPMVSQSNVVSGSGSLIIPQGFIEAIITGKGQTGVDAVVDTIASPGTPMYFRKTTETTPQNTWRATITNGTYNESTTEVIRISSTGIVNKSDNFPLNVPVWNNFNNTNTLVGNFDFCVTARLDGYYYVLTQNGTGYRSQDGETWSPLNGLSGLVGLGVSVRKIIYSPVADLFIITTNGGVFCKSTDGINFTIHDFITEFGNNYALGITDVAYSGTGQFVGIYGSGNESIVTTDFITLQKLPMQTVNSGGVPRKLASLGSRVVAYGYVGVTENQYQYTDNGGTTWTKVTFPGNIPDFNFHVFDSVDYSFIVSENVDDNLTKYYSTDFINWVNISSSYPVKLPLLYVANGLAISQPYLDSSNNYFGDNLYYGKSETAGTTIEIEPAITGLPVVANLMNNDYNLLGSNNSTPPNTQNTNVQLNSQQQTTVNYTVPVGADLTISYQRPEATALLVPGLNNKTSSKVNEGEEAIFLYTLNNTLEREVGFQFNLTLLNAVASDISNIEFRVGNNQYQTLADQDIITLPIGQTNFNIKFLISDDLDVENEEFLKFSLTKILGSAVIRNTQPLTQLLTIVNTTIPTTTVATTTPVTTVITTTTAPTTTVPPTTNITTTVAPTTTPVTTEPPTTTIATTTTIPPTTTSSVTPTIFDVLFNSIIDYDTNDRGVTLYSTGNGIARTVHSVTSGTWYVEITDITSLASVGVCLTSNTNNDNFLGSGSEEIGLFVNGSIYSNGTVLQSIIVGDYNTIGILLDATARTVSFITDGNASFPNSFPIPGTEPIHIAVSSADFGVTATLNSGQLPFVYSSRIPNGTNLIFGT